MPTLAPLPKPALTSSPGLVVLDTNVVLDWLLFADRHGLTWGRAVEQRRLTWIATPDMRDEFAQVLGRGLASAWGAHAAALLDAWDRHATPTPPAPSSCLACTDPDDQMFLDLALHAGAAWLVTRDRELLRLKTRALTLGTLVLKPEDSAKDDRLCALLHA